MRPSSVTCSLIFIHMKKIAWNCSRIYISYLRNRNSLIKGLVHLVLWYRIVSSEQQLTNKSSHVSFIWCKVCLFEYTWENVGTRNKLENLSASVEFYFAFLHILFYQFYYSIEMSVAYRISAIFSISNVQFFFIFYDYISFRWIKFLFMNSVLSDL